MGTEFLNVLVLPVAVKKHMALLADWAYPTARERALPQPSPQRSLQEKDQSQGSCLK